MDAFDAFPNDATEWADLDGDGLGDNSDPDRDGDTVLNDEDAYPDDPTRSALPVLVIESPASLITVGHSPIAVSGKLDPAAAELTVNGVLIPTGGSGIFAASVPLTEGHNTVSARMVMPSGDIRTASIAVSLDLTPPYITVESHQDFEEVYTDHITVTGLINDIVRGTVEQDQAVVTVNGVPAQIRNRSYMASGVALSAGLNNITLHAQDQVGNVATTSFHVIYNPLGNKQLALLSGDQQVANINDWLPQPLMVKLTNEQGAPVANADVLFRVIQGAGVVLPSVDSAEEAQAVKVTTNAGGEAGVTFRVGSRVGGR